MGGSALVNLVMLKDITSQAAALRNGLRDLREQARQIDLGGPKSVVLTGSGDSYIASIAVEALARQRLTADVRALPSLDASRYITHGGDDLIVVVSVSGEVARTIEVAERATLGGARALAITCNGDSTLARVCGESLVMPKPIDRSIPHSRDYTATLLALTACLERLAGTTFPQLDLWVDAVDGVIAQSFDLLEEKSWARTRWWFLGAGPDRASAMFGALKFWEAAGMEAWWDDLEEFAHGSQLMARPGDYATLIASRQGVQRAQEMIAGLRKMGLEPITVGPTEMRVPECFHLPTHDELDDPVWHPFVACLPLQVITYLEATARSLDVSVPLYGHAHGPAYDAVHVEWTKRSKIWLEGSAP
jgi:fructoselysine-6-P-deglycase FrlB-like protein